jgi:hypothetical protein
MIITLSSIKERTRTSKKGKKYKVVEVIGNKWGSNEEWSTDIFKNKNDLLEELDEFGPGDVANFKFNTNGQWPELEEIVEPSKADLEKAEEAAQKPAPQRGMGRPKGGGGGLTKEEWAAKDAKKEASIARAVAIKLAVENTKVGTKADVLIKHAIEFMPFLLGEDEALFDAPASPEDALDPPVDED